MLRRMFAMVAVLLSLAGLAVASAGPASASSEVSCFGYTGTFADPYPEYPTVVAADWGYGVDNCFGISPGRHIWSTAPGHPWATIPGDGLADGISALWETGTSTAYVKHIQVWIASSGNYYCQAYTSSVGWNSDWSRC
ncbi:MAG: hypothetical protein JO144_00245 [Actinobacteria bacterium]|nr:hypothetical protein [Actinomycetota bacterium]